MHAAQVQTVIIGAGVIGLAIGAQIARKGGRAIVFECCQAIGSGISSRGSRVIHSGIYYPEESLKRRFCVEGQRLLYVYCDSHDVAYRKCGKLVVATSDAEIAKIEAIARQAERNGIEGTQLIDGSKAREFEPELAAVAALHVREAGIIHCHAYMSSLSAEIESAGGAVFYRRNVVGGRCAAHSFEIRVG